MGNRQSLLQQISIYKPPAEDIYLKDPGNQFKIYQHRYKSYELMAHKLTLNDEDALPILIDNFKARYQHHYLVSTVFLACEDYSACGGYYETVIFYQRIFTNLSKIKDIPFQDVLHFYAVAFKGFQILYRRFGYFQIYEDMFHLGQDSKLKVWCNKDISKNEPQPYLLDKNGSEQDMIRKIIFLVSENTDPYTDKINLKDKLFRFGVRNFQMANQSLRQICRQYNLAVPERLTCISTLPSQEVKMMLDLYTSNSNNLSQNLLASDSKLNSNSPFPVENIPQSAQINNPHSNKSLFDGFMTPHFHNPSVSHTPITQQFTILPPPREIPPVQIQPLQKRQTELSMIHTFNRAPQMPVNDHRRGIELSLTKQRQNKPSLHTRKLSQSRNRSLPINNKNHFIAPNVPKFYSLEKKPDIKINFVNKNNGWANAIVNGVNNAQRFDKTLHTQKLLAGPTIHKPVNQAGQNYHYFQPNQLNKVAGTSKSRVIFSSPSVPHNHVGISSNHQPSNYLNYTPILTNSILNQSTSQKSVDVMRKSESFAKNSNTNLQKSYSTSNLNAKQSLPTYQPLLHQFRQRRASSKQKLQAQHIILIQPQKLRTNKVNSREFLQRNQSNQQLSKDETGLTNKFQQNQLNKNDNIVTSPQTPVNQVQNINTQTNKLYLEVPFNTSANPHQFDAHSASSRYLYSNRQLNDNIPDIKYKKASSPKKTINKLFDTKMQQLQSFNQSKFGTQNSLRQPENSRVLQIIGRDKKDSITSAFGDHQHNKKTNPSKENHSYTHTNQIKIQSSYKFSEGFTDPKILQILKRPSSKALKTQLNNTIKKVSKATKQIDFSQDYVKKPFISRQVRQDMLKLQSWQIQGNKSKEFNSYKSNLLNFQGFPSLSNLSEINKAEENSFNEDNKLNLMFSNKNNISGKSRFSEEKMAGGKKQENAVSDFYNFDYQSPTYEYSFSSKREIPIQDTQWRARYATSTNQKSLKDESTMLYNKSNNYRVAPEKPFNNYLTGFNSNQSLASLEYELGQKLAAKNGNDQVKQTMGSSGKFARISNDSVEVSFQRGNRKYNPKIDPEISKDLERFRRQKQGHKNV